DISTAKDSGWYNFYHPQFVKDLDADGLNDLLVVNGGDASKSYTDTVGRPAGKLLILSSKTGKILHSGTAPDAKEMYMAPVIHDFDGNGSQTIIYGTGGETYSGSLYRIELNDFLKDNSLAKSKPLIFTPKSGFIPPACIADLDDDNIMDLVVQAYNGTIYALDGKTFLQKWKVENKGFETQCTPAIGNFTGSYHPDVFAVLYKGNTPSFKDYRQLLIDGKTGKVAFKDSLADLHFTSPSAFDFTGDGRDEAILSYNFRKGGKWIHEIVALDFKTRKTEVISSSVGTDLACTPLIHDLNKNGKLDLVYAHRLDSLSPQIPNGFAVKTHFGIADAHAVGVAWGSYLGTNWNGTYFYGGKNCGANGPEISGFTTDPFCNGDSDGKVQIAVTGGTSPFQYVWSNGAVTKDLNNVPAGNYQVRVVDANGCQAFKSFEVLNPYGISTSSFGDLCKGDNDGYAQISSSGCKCANSGCVFTWSNGEQDHTITGLKPGIYWVKVEHPTGCVVYDTVEVAQAEPLIDSFTVENVSCFGANDGRIRIYPREKAEFVTKWSTGEVNSYVIDGLAPNTYSVEMRNLFYCKDTLEVEIKEPDTLEHAVFRYEHITCFGAKNGFISIRGFGGTRKYKYWLNGKEFSDSLLQNLDTGNYSFKVIDANGCESASENLRLAQPSKLGVNLSQKAESDLFVEDGIARAKAFGGVPPYTYKWSDKDSQTLDSAINLKAGRYKVTVTDAKECTTIGEIEVKLTSGVNESESMLVNLYPNPTNEILFIETNFKEITVVELTNMQGQVLQIAQPLEHSVQLNLTQLQLGAYLVKIRLNDQIVIRQVLKQ
ncbi:MAG: T9SS type A sorting domain-containing protein, partial [Bacteroidetes bacterium]|nr:T9SS type A sorting domain-containing protein [Bacteroidota bacterium]